MRKKRTIVIALFCVLVLFVGGFAYQQRDNIRALCSIGKNTTEEIQQMRQQNGQARTDAIANIGVREFTAEEKQALKSGELSQEEALARITGIPTTTLGEQGGTTSQFGGSGTTRPKDEDPSSEPEGNKPTTEKPKDGEPGSEPEEHKPTTEVAVAEESKDSDVDLANLVGKIYVLEANFTSKLEDLLDTAIAEYRSLPADMHTFTNQLNIGARYMGVATAMEKQCDEQMATLLSQIERVLVASGGNTALVGEIRDAYHSQKALTKNYYLSLYS